MNSLKIVFIAIMLLIISYFTLHLSGLDKILKKRLRNVSTRSHGSLSSSPQSRTRSYQRKDKSKLGYVLATHYSDQLTGSTANVLSLQCWASTVPGNIRVVEPFLHYGSILGFNLNPYPDNSSRSDTQSGPRYGERQKFENTIKLSEVVNITEWNDLVSARSLASLVSWNYFIQHAPRQLIIVDQVCDDAISTCMRCRNDDFFESNLFLKFAVRFAHFYKFRLVRKICYKMMTYTPKEFLEEVYGPYKPQDSVVIFNHFGGLEKHGDKYRISVELERCSRGHYFHPSIGTSPQILKESAIYVDRYMPKARIHGYVAVLVRIEKIATSHNFQALDKEEQSFILNTCVEEMVDAITTIKNEESISEVFLGTDSGKYGSAYMRGNIDYIDVDVLEEGLDRLYKLLFGNVTVRKKMMARINSVVSVQSPGYVAQLEKSIAANATCLVLAGGGYFQDVVKDLYYKCNVASLEKMCKVEIIEC